MSLSLANNFISGACLQGFKDPQKESLVKAFDKINIESGNISISEELDRVLDQITEMDMLYSTYLKTHCCFMRFIINLCWWKSSAHGSYVSCRRALVGRVAAGYENKMITLLTCKYFLKSESHRLFCDAALKQAIANTHQKKDVRGLVWTVVNTKGVTNYLIGTMHQGTKAMAQAKGVVEAIQSSEKFFTEKGLLYSWWKSAHFPLMTKDWRFLFILDRHIALEARKKNKANFALDNVKLEKETDKVVEEIRKESSEKTRTIDLTKEAPAIDYFTSPKLKVDSSHPLVAEIGKIYLPQTINLWQKGDESEIIEFHKPFFTKDIYALADLRTKAWLEHSFESYGSEKSFPGLIQQIREANKPICIAVGDAHCMGADISLVEEFRKAGFQVSRFE